MANATIDTLQVKISANAQSATKSLDSLASALRRVKSALSGVDKNGVAPTQRISRSINDLNNALQNINTSGVKKLNDMASALHKYASAVKSAKGINVGKAVTSSVKDVNKALGIINSTASSNAGATASGSPDALSANNKASSFLRDSGVFNKIIAAQELKEHNKALRDMGVFASRSSKGVNSLSKELKDTTKRLREAHIFSGKFLKAIGRIALYRAIRSALKAIAQAFEEGLKNAYMYSKQSETFTRLAETLDHLKSVVAQMTNQLGAFWGEFKQFIAPAVNWLIEKVRQASERLTELFAALNGEKTYLQAQYVAQEWAEATDNVKKYKQQLLGLDELNNLTTQTSGKDDEIDYSKLYKEVSVSDGLLKVGEQWNALKEKVIESVKAIELALAGFMVGVGAVLLFSGANIPLGLGLLVAGGFMASKAIKERWDTLGSTLEGKIGLIETMLGGFLLGIGAVLAFSGANLPLGIGLMAVGGATLLEGQKDLNWNSLNKKTKTKLTRLTTIISAALLAVGGVLAFSGANLPLGIGMMAVGAVGLAKNAVQNWDNIKQTLDEKLPLIEGVVAGATGAIGAVLLFSGANVPLGIGLLVASGLMVAKEIIPNWDTILDGLKDAWKNIEDWWKDTIVPAVEEKANWVKSKLDKLREDMNPDSTTVTTPVTKTEIQLNPFPSVIDAVTEDLSKDPVQNTKEKAGNVWNAITDVLTDTWDDTKRFWNDFSEDVSSSIFGQGYRWLKKQIVGDAMGGVHSQGTLFYAGEAGAEFVGNIGSTSAVANTGQMTDAIYKAAYMGMSRALQENGGGMNGYEPATMDDLYIAIKKKSNAFSKRTGMPSTI